MALIMFPGQAVGQDRPQCGSAAAAAAAAASGTNPLKFHLQVYQRLHDCSPYHLPHQDGMALIVFPRQAVRQACRFLYQLGFPQLGIQSGNIFVEDGNLRLGGFENTLFGYRAVGSEKFQQYYEHLEDDVWSCSV